MKLRYLLAVAVGLAAPAAGANAQCAGNVGVTNIHNCAPAVSVQLTDEMFGWQINQNPHTRRVTVGQILGALNGGTQVGSPSTSDNLVMAPNGTTPQLVSINALLAMIGPPTLSQVVTALTYTPLRPANNLSDIADPVSARANLGIQANGTTSTGLMPTWTTPGTVNANIAYNTATGRFDFVEGGSARNYVRLSGDTLTGALHMGANTIDGSAITFSGGTINGVAIGATTPSTGAFSSLKVGTGTGNITIQQASTGAVFGFLLGAASGSYRFFDSTAAVTYATIGGTLGNFQTNVPLHLQPSSTYTTVSSGSGPSSASAIWMNNAWSGSTSNGDWAPIFIQAADNVNTGTGSGYAMKILLNSGGNQNSGGRAALQVNANISSAAPASTTPFGQFVDAVNAFANMNVSDGGTFQAPRGRVFGINNVAAVAVGATGAYGAIGQEIDVNTGEQTWTKFGIVSTNGVGGLDRYQGAYDDTAFGTSGSSIIGNGANPSPGWRYAYSVGRRLGGVWPVSPTGWIFGLVDNQTTNTGSTYESMTAGYGFDLAYGTFNSYSLRLPGANGPITVDGAGVVQIGSGLVNATTSGLNIDGSGSVATAVTLNGGGTNYQQGTVFYFGNGGRGRILTVNGSGVVLTYTIYSYPSYNTTSPPATLSATVDGAGSGQASSASGLVLNVTWATGRNTIALNASGGATTAGGSLSAASYKVGATAGVTCSGTPTSSFASVSGIVTHC